jgi:hypothetical protein
MPDDRFFHKRAGHSDKVNRLTDFEELVWRYYVLSSDDFGVMRFTAGQIRTDHERAEGRTERVVQRALDRIRDVGLVHVFEHQGRAYCYSRNWQRFQKVTYPRETMLPCPEVSELLQCEDGTALLFVAHPGGKENLFRQKPFAESFENGSATISEILSERFPLTRAGALAQAQAMAPAEGSGQGWGATRSQRAGGFCQWYADTHERLIGVGYIGNPNRDYMAALQLVDKFPDEELRDAGTFWFGQKDKFATEGTRTISKFASRASDIVLQLRKLRVAS